MRVLDSPLNSPFNTLLDFDKETNPLPLYDQDYILYTSNLYSPPMFGRGSKKEDGGDISGTLESVTWGASSSFRGPPHIAGLANIPDSSPADAHSSIILPSMCYVPGHSDGARSYLTRASHSSDRRESPVSDAVGSIYSWSSAAGPDKLKTSTSVDSRISSTEPSPFMQPYYFTGSSQPSIPALPQATSGYTAKPMDKWAVENHTDGGFHQPAAHYPVINPLTSYSTEVLSTSYPPIHQLVHNSAGQWVSVPALAAPPTTSSDACPALAPFPPTSATPVVSCESSSTISPSPAPTLSDMEPTPSRRCRQQSSPSSNPADLRRYGVLTADGAWRCAHPGCTSQAVFRRGCDLRKHFNRHRKHLFCRHEGCPQSRQGGFSSKKDRARHEAKHNPGILCEWSGCGRVFSRVDNMKDHVRRIHRRSRE